VRPSKFLSAIRQHNFSLSKTLPSSTSTTESPSKLLAAIRPINFHSLGNPTCAKSKLLPSIQEFRSEMSSFRKMLRRFERDLTGTDCGDRFCTLSYHFKDVCILYEETENVNCSIPCVLSGCKTEIFRMGQCPVWTCEQVSTTQPTPTSSTTASSTSSAPFSSSQSPPMAPTQIILFTSLSINAFVFLILCLGIWWCIRKRRIIRTQQQQQSEQT
jgi:hypothetical protein